LLAMSPGRADGGRQLLLEGDLPSEQLRTELLGWAGDGQILAAVQRPPTTRRGTLTRTWRC